MYNELFEGVIRMSGENTNDIDDFDDRDNFWAPIPENLLFERILREMAVLNNNQFRNSFESSLASRFDGRHSKNQINIEIIQQIVDVIVLNNNTIQDPFAIVDNNEVLVINDACNEYQLNLTALISRKYKSFIIKKIDTTEPLNSWIENVINELFNSNKVIKNNIINVAGIQQSSFIEVVQTNFNQLYLALQRGQLTR